MTPRMFVTLIVQAVAQHFKVSTAEIRGTRKHAGIVRARWVGLWLVRELVGLSYPKIGQAFGGIDHSTVINACKHMRERLAADPRLREAVASIREQVAVKIPEVSCVAPAMHLTVRAGPPRIVVELEGEQPVEVAACIITRSFGENDGRMARGEAWLASTPDLEALRDRLVAPVWSKLSTEVSADKFRCGRIMLSPSTLPPPPEVVAQMPPGAAIRSARVLVIYDDSPPMTEGGRAFHVLRICHSEETSVEAVRAGEVIHATSHNAAADIWVAEQERHSAFGEGDHFDLVVMDESGRHIVLDVTTQVKAVLKLSDVQGLS